MAVLCPGLRTRGSRWSVVSDAMMGGLGGEEGANMDKMKISFRHS